MDKHYSELSTDEKARLVADFLNEKKGLDVLALDVRELCAAAEAMIIVHVTSERQARALADNLKAFAREEKLEWMGVEGYDSAQWLLLDLNDVIVHVFQEATRLHFNLEGLWSKAPVLADHSRRESVTI